MMRAMALPPFSPQPNKHISLGVAITFNSSMVAGVHAVRRKIPPRICRAKSVFPVTSGSRHSVRRAGADVLFPTLLDYSISADIWVCSSNQALEIIVNKLERARSIQPSARNALWRLLSHWPDLPWQTDSFVSETPEHHRLGAPASLAFDRDCEAGSGYLKPSQEFAFLRPDCTAPARR